MTGKYLLVVATALGLSSNSVADTSQLFTGKDLSEWRHVGFGSFDVENGVLRARGGVGLLWLETKQIGNSVLRIVYKVDAREDNSGVFVRIPETPEAPGCRLIRVSKSRSTARVSRDTTKPALSIPSARPSPDLLG